MKYAAAVVLYKLIKTLSDATDHEWKPDDVARYLQRQSIPIAMNIYLDKAAREQSGDAQLNSQTVIFDNHPLDDQKPGAAP